MYDKWLNKLNVVGWRHLAVAQLGQGTGWGAGAVQRLKWEEQRQSVKSVFYTENVLKWNFTCTEIAMWGAELGVKHWGEWGLLCNTLSYT